MPRLHPAAAFAAMTSCAILPPPADTGCHRPDVSISGWPVVESPRLQGIRFQLPTTFRRSPAEESFNGSPEPRASLWTASDVTQVSVSLGDAANPLFSRFPTADERPEYSRCEESINGARATIVSFNKLEWVGGDAVIGPFQIYAELRFPDGRRIYVSAMTDSRTHYEQVLRGIRTMQLEAH